MGTRGGAGGAFDRVRPGLAVLLALGALLVAACSSTSEPDEASPDTTSPPAQRYETSGTVIGTDQHAMLCHGWGESRPPSCSGPPIGAWDWASVPHETAGSTKFGHYDLVVTWDERAHRYELAGEPSVWREPPREPTDFTPGCPDPEGGWRAADGLTDADLAAFLAVASDSEDFAGHWVVGGLGPGDGPGFVITNVGFLREVEAHRERLEPLWPGPLCVTERTHTLDQLRAIQDELFSMPTGPTALAKELDVSFVTLNEWRGVVELSTFIASPELEAELDARWGPGAIELQALLRPVD